MMEDSKPYTGRIEIHRTILEEVAKYPHVLDTIREYVCNGWDADAERLEITVDANELKIEDWGSGISNWSLFWGVADQHKSEVQQTTRFKRKPIGRKGLGKLSYSMIGKEISVETRTANKAEFSYPVKQFTEFEAIPRRKIDEVLNHKGTQITIRDLKIKLDKDKVIQYIKENLYGLILPIACPTHPMMILVNGQKVQPTLFAGTRGQISTQYGDIRCNLTPTKTAKIDALFRGVKVREVNPAPTHPAKGYFDVDWIIPTPDRSNFTASKESDLFFSEIKKYILRNIPAKSDATPKDLEKALKDLSKLFDDILRDLNILPETEMPIAKSSKPSDLKMAGTDENNPDEEENKQEEKEPESERKRIQHKILMGPERPIKSAYGINYIIKKYGVAKPAVVAFKEEKLIIINLDHDLVKNIRSLKPSMQIISLAPLVSRGIWHILENYTDLNGYEEYIDDMTSSLFLKMFSETE